ncbi:unnamed protein product [Miscanthus lutarioriparius]|uniref:Uncharacterized protein n=1 Tax=Miscanthus lutarioriparius TaxID=422564 RepID=A0A811QBR7_9POAL|nr:unnamed protein product [Miscanthus lutarioriparius]
MVQNQLERKKPLLRKVYTSKKRLSKKKEDFEGPHSLHGPLELPSTGQNIGVNEIAESQREPSLVVPFVKNSCLWSAVEEMNVFKEFPQQPHFLPLQQEYPRTLQGGMAFGLMVAFDLFVRSISKSSIADNEGSFEEEKSTLSALKINGFDVQCFERLLDELIKVKFEYSKHLEEKSAVQRQKQQTMNSLSQNDSLLCEIDNDIAELEKKLGLLRQKGQLIEKEKEHDEEKLSRLNVVESNIEQALDVHTLQFNGILAEVKQKRLT